MTTGNGFTGNNPTKPARRSRMWILLAPVVLLVVVIIGTIFGGTSQRPVSQPSALPTTTTSTSTTTTTVVPVTTTTLPPPPPPPPVTAPTSSVEADPLDPVDVGGCLRNAGTDTDPAMEPSPCKRGTYKVLARKFGTIDGNVCNGVPRRTHSYIVQKFLIRTLNGVEVSRTLEISQSYVFCLRQV